MTQATWVDVFIIVIIVLSTFISLVRGFMKEFLSLLSWIGAFYLGYRYFELIAFYLEPYIANHSIRYALAFLAIFLSAMILFGLITYFILKVLKISGMNTTDKCFGAIFGAARGVLIVNLLIVVGSTLSLTSYVWWRESFMINNLTPQVVWLKRKLPELNDKFKFYVKRQQEQDLAGRRRNDSQSEVDFA